MADPRPWVYGTDGPDIIASAGRNAHFSGEGGDDVLYAGTADDLVRPLDGSRPFPDPYLSRAFTATAGTLAGAAGDDTLYGTGGPDMLYGGDGNDLLIGGEVGSHQAGDYLNGGPGADVFRWRPLSADKPITDTHGDQVADFEVGVDKLDLSAYQNPHYPGAVWAGTQAPPQGTQLTVGWYVDDAGATVVRYEAPYSTYAGPFPSQVPYGRMEGQFKVHIINGGTLSASDFILGGPVNILPPPAPVTPPPPDPHFVDRQPSTSAAPVEAASSPAAKVTQPPAAQYAFASEHQAQAARLYNAAMDRRPDAEGLAFWTNSLDQGHSLDTLARGFMASPEWQARYGVPDNKAFVELLYKNVLDRPGEAEGVAFWTANLDAGRAERAGTVVGFSESAENVWRVSADNVFG